jgi:hypothetical protein
MVFDVRSEAMCRQCGAVWRRTIRKTVELVAA